MSQIAQLNLNKRRPDNSGINFADKNSVEQFLATEQFRPCVNLECQPLELKIDTLYMPACLDQRFAREGVAKDIPIYPDPRGLSPITYTTLPLWAPLVSCPRDCKGFKHRRIAKLQHVAKMVAHTLHPKEWMNAAVWAWIVKWKFWVLLGSIAAIVMKHLIG